jgi:hypothetical protein
VLFEPRKTFQITRKQQGADRQKEQPLENRKDQACNAEYEKNNTKGNAYETLHMFCPVGGFFGSEATDAPVLDRLRKNV